MINAICLNEKYSTTRLLTKEKPIIKNSPEDKFETLLFLPENKNRKGEGGLRTQGYFKKSYEDKPLLSVITVVYNGEKYLEETILSVLNQSYSNVEYIIIDGGSTDGTVDIIKKYEDKIDYWVSESDEGIYDAMNKGIGFATGEIIGIVNADDVIYSKTIRHVAKIMQNNSRLDYVYGTIDLAKSSGEVYGHFRPLNETELSTRLYTEMPFAHPSLYVRSKVYKTLGTYNKSYRLSSDYDFILTLIEKKLHKYELLENMGFFRDGGESGGIESFVENKKILFSHGVSSSIVYKNFIKSYIKMIIKKVLPKSIFQFLKKFKRNPRHILYHE